jgi:Flp pilus assembly protein TadG
MKLPIRSRWGALREKGAETGAAVTSFVVVLLLAIFLMIGLTVDGGAHVKAMTRAERVATDAAHAGLQYYQSLVGPPDAGAAVAAAEQYLVTANTDGSLTGTAEIVGPDKLLVSVTIRTKTTFLGLIGIDDLTSTGSGQADLVHKTNGA